MNGYPKNFYSWLVFILMILFITGCLLIPNTLEMRLEQTIDWQLPSSVRSANTALHALGAFVTIWLLGAVWTIHIRSGWRKRKHHHSGIALCLMFLLLTLTGLGIYYMGDDTQAMWSALIHIATALLATALAIYHIVVGRKISPLR